MLSNQKNLSIKKNYYGFYIQNIAKDDIEYRYHIRGEEICLK